MHRLNLSQVPLNVQCVVDEVEDSEIGRRIMEIGISPGTVVEKSLGSSPGNPIGVLVENNFLLGLRKEEAELIFVYLPV